MNGSRSVIALAIALTIGLCSVLALPAYAIDVGRYGMVKTAAPEHQARGFVIFFSGHDGLTASDEAAARAIAGVGALVAEVNTPAYLSVSIRLMKNAIGWLAIWSCLVVSSSATTAFPTISRPSWQASARAGRSRR